MGKSALRGGGGQLSIERGVLFVYLVGSVAFGHHILLGKWE